MSLVVLAIVRGINWTERGDGEGEGEEWDRRCVWMVCEKY